MTAPSRIPTPLRRRALQIAALALLALWIWGAPRLADLQRQEAAFVPIEGAAPFRRATREGSVTQVSPALIGLAAGDAAPVPTALMQEVAADPCAALFGDIPPDAVPVAVFSDINCPNCPGLERSLAGAIAASDRPVVLTRHEFPLLGAGSALAARALIAARGQNGDIAGFIAALQRTPVIIDTSAIARIAAAQGYDATRLVAQMSHPATLRTFDRSRALAALLGLYGTPATIIGDRVLLGGQPTGALSDHIAAAPVGPGLCRNNQS